MHLHVFSKTAIAVLIGAGSASAEDPQVRLVQYQVGAALSDKVPFQVKPMNHAYGAKLAFLIEGKDLVSIADDSLEITALTAADGSELVPLKGRGAAWEQGSFPRVSEDGSVGSFDLEIRGDLMGRLEGSEIEGKITVRSGTETETLSESLELGAAAREIGPFKIRAKTSKGFGGDEGLAVEVVGDYESIVDLAVSVGTDELEGQGTSWSGKTKTFSFPKTDAEAVKMELSFWTDLKDLDVPFKVRIGAK